MDPFLWLVIALIIIVVAVVVSLGMETVRFNLLLLLIPLFSRMSKDKVLDNKTRHAIHGLIIDNPDIHFAAIIKEYDIAQGAAAYHLDVLEREAFIKSVRDGRLKRFYTVDTMVPEDPRKTPDEIREAVMAMVKDSPGITQMALVRELSIDHKTLGYHIGTLIKEGFITDSRKGRNTVYQVK